MSPVAERTRAISVVKLHPDIGAEIRGVDLSRPLDEETVRAIKDAWHRHAVLLFRDQKLSEDDQRRFAAHFGPVAKRVPPKPGAPGAEDALVWDDMMTISDHVDANGKALGSLGHGEMWFHTDKCYHRRPHRATFLYGIEIPSEGGHTQFSSMYAAYENLPAELKQQLDGAMVIQGQQYGVGRRIDVTLPLRAPITARNRSSSPIPAPAAKRSTSPARTRCGSKAWTAMKAKRCCNGCSPSPRIRPSSTSTSGDPATSSCGTTSRACTPAPIGRANSAARCAAAPSRASRCTSIHHSRKRVAGNSVNRPRRTFLQMAAVAAALPVLPRMARSLDYPTRPVRVIVGFPAGTGPDVIARLIGQRIGDRLGQQFFVENRSGAGSSLAAQDVVTAPADGYTLLLAANANAVNASLYPNLPFNFVRDIAAVGMICSAPFLLTANLGVPAKTFPEFIAYAKANPGKINMASPGIGTTPHLMYELLKLMTGIELVHVPYRTGYIPDLLSGQVQVAFSTVTQAMAYVRDGKLRALAVSSATRSEVLPDVPAVGESVPGYDASGWFGIWRLKPRRRPSSTSSTMRSTPSSPNRTRGRA